MLHFINLHIIYYYYHYYSTLKFVVNNIYTELWSVSYRQYHTQGPQSATALVVCDDIDTLLWHFHSYAPEPNNTMMRFPSVARRCGGCHAHELRAFLVLFHPCSIGVGVCRISYGRIASVFNKIVSHVYAPHLYI